MKQSIFYSVPLISSPESDSAAIKESKIMQNHKKVLFLVDFDFSKGMYRGVMMIL